MIVETVVLTLSVVWFCCIVIWMREIGRITLIRRREEQVLDDMEKINEVFKMQQKEMWEILNEQPNAQCD